MTAESIIERISQKPFRAFALETTDDTWIEVDREEDVLVYRRTPPVRITIFDASGRLYILEPEQIAAIESK